MKSKTRQDADCRQDESPRRPLPRTNGLKPRSRFLNHMDSNRMRRVPAISARIPIVLHKRLDGTGAVRRANNNCADTRSRIEAK